MPYLMSFKEFQRRRVVRRVIRKKRERAASIYLYREHPKTSFIIQSYNHRENIIPIRDGLRRIQDAEIIACDDGSVDGSEHEWTKALDGPNEYVIHSNDLHEIRAYNRAIRYANGEIVCLLQDDDIPPAQSDWYQRAIDLFAEFEKMVILGGCDGFNGFEAHAQKATLLGRVEMPADGYRKDLKFVQMINIGPVFIRRQAFLKMGGFDLAYSSVGHPGIHFDHEISLRTWLNPTQA